MKKDTIYFACLCDLVGETVVQYFDVNGKKTVMTGDQAYLLFTFNTGKKYICMNVRTINTIFTLQNCSVVRQPEAASCLSAIHLFLLKEYRCTDCKHSVCTHFFFLLFFSGQKRHHTLYQCSTPMPTSMNDMESTNGMVSDYWNILL